METQQRIGRYTPESKHPTIKSLEAKAVFRLDGEIKSYEFYLGDDLLLFLEANPENQAKFEDVRLGDSFRLITHKISPEALTIVSVSRKGRPVIGFMVTNEHFQRSTKLL